RVTQDGRGARAARDREGGAPGLGGRQAQGQRKVSRQGHGHARRDRLLPRDQRRDRAGVRSALDGMGAPPLASRQSTVTPLALIRPAHFSISFLTNWPRSCGVGRSSDTTTAPGPSSRSFTVGVFIAWTAASLSFLTTSADAPFGRKVAFQV